MVNHTWTTYNKPSHSVLAVTYYTTHTRLLNSRVNYVYKPSSHDETTTLINLSPASPAAMRSTSRMFEHEGVMSSLQATCGYYSSMIEIINDKKYSKRRTFIFYNKQWQFFSYTQSHKILYNIYMYIYTCKLIYMYIVLNIYMYIYIYRLHVNFIIQNVQVLRSLQACYARCTLL